MIISKEIEFKLNQFNSHHYKRLGYDTDNKESIMIKIEDIGKGTMVKVKVECDVCKRVKEIGYRKYFKNIYKYGIYSCSNKCSMFKNIKTNMEKYGVSHQCKNIKTINKILETKLEKGLISDSIIEFIDYRRVVNNKTNRNKKLLFEKWDGTDYYDSEYIFEYLKLGFNDYRYPTIDHKTSVLYGFVNKISPENIADIENLCYTKRCNNSSKSSMVEEDYINKKDLK